MKAFPRFFVWGGVVRRYDNETEHGTRMYPSGVTKPTKNFFKDALDLVSEGSWREITAEEAAAILKGEKEFPSS